MIQRDYYSLGLYEDSELLESSFSSDSKRLLFTGVMEGFVIGKAFSFYRMLKV
jgi:hypothetical protein